MKKIICLLVAVAVIFGTVSLHPVTASPDNLVVNGDFEYPVVTASQKWDIYDSGTAGLGWTVEWAGAYSGAPSIAKLELHRGVLGPANTGFQYAELDTDWGYANNEQASVKIYQDIETCVGGEYTLSYAWSPRPRHNNNGLKVYWGGILENTHSGSGSSNPVWHIETIENLTGNGLTRLEFIETANPDSLGMFLDSVSLEQTKECASICELTDQLTEADDAWTEESLGVNRWMFDGEEWITHRPEKSKGKGPQKNFSIEDTQGCNCEQILTWLHNEYPEEYGKMKGHWKFGCSISVMERFIDLSEEGLELK